MPVFARSGCTSVALARPPPRGSGRCRSGTPTPRRVRRRSFTPQSGSWVWTQPRRRQGWSANSGKPQASSARVIRPSPKARIPGRVDEACAVSEVERRGSGGRVGAASIALAHPADRLRRRGQERVDERRLAHAGVADEGADPCPRAAPGARSSPIPASALTGTRGTPAAAYGCEQGEFLVAQVDLVHRDDRPPPRRARCRSGNGPRCADGAAARRPTRRPRRRPRSPRWRGSAPCRDRSARARCGV